MKFYFNLHRKFTRKERKSQKALVHLNIYLWKVNVNNRDWILFIVGLQMFWWILKSWKFLQLSHYFMLVQNPQKMALFSLKLKVQMSSTATSSFFEKKQIQDSQLNFSTQSPFFRNFPTPPSVLYDSEWMKTSNWDKFVENFSFGKFQSKLLQQFLAE